MIERLLNQSNNGNRINNNTKINHSGNMIHFINCGLADSILIESNGKYGLVDSSNPYNGSINEVEPAQIDESIGEKDFSKESNNSVKAVLNYLSYLKIDKLDFIIGTHSHSDHIGGIPAIAYYYVPYLSLSASSHSHPRMVKIKLEYEHCHTREPKIKYHNI